MSHRTDIAYAYDGTFEGLMCCVFECFEKKESPTMLISPRSDQMTLFETRMIKTDIARADRVIKAIPKKISAEALSFAEQGMLCSAEEIDLSILRFVCLGFRAGAGVAEMLAEPCVGKLMKALGALWGEAHLLSGFIRFTDTGGALTATISPRNRVLSVLEAHFCDRYNAELFMIYDLTHKEALVHQGEKSGIYPVEHLELPALSDKEQYIRALWRQFHKSINIESRANPICQLNHMPKRFWAHIFETFEASDTAQNAHLWYNDRDSLAHKEADRHPNERSNLLPEAQP